jgi:predicted Zn-dependent protease
MYGDALLQSQQVDRAIPILERVAKAPDAPPASRALLGRAYVLAGKFAEAVPELETALEPDEDGDVHYQLARAYQALGRADEAQKALQEYQRRRPAAPATDAAADPPDATLTPPND